MPYPTLRLSAPDPKFEDLKAMMGKALPENRES
jgi:hypothetical protein